jgi:uncharacterized protein with HEPN domain
MFDKNLILKILEQIRNAIQTIQRRFEPIRTAHDFTDSEGGVEKLDAICMQLIAIGESLKNLDSAGEIPVYQGRSKAEIPIYRCPVKFILMTA